MTRLNHSDFSIDEIMQKIREEATRRKQILHKDTDQEAMQPPSPPSSIGTYKPRSSFDNFLWKYGTRYAKTIKEFPILKNIAEKQHSRLASSEGFQTTSGASVPSNGETLDYLAVNWYYHTFLEQIKNEGLKGKIKLLIFKYLGFFAWWQGQINRAIYSELNRQKLMQDLINQKIEALRNELDERYNVLLNQKIEALRNELDERYRMIEDMNDKLMLIDRSVDALYREMSNQGEDISKQTEKIRDFRLSISDQQRRLTVIFEEVRKRLTEPLTTEELGNILKEEDHLLDSLYGTFEDQFRGTRGEIKKRQRIYLPYIEQAQAGTEEAPVLDAGCGRGEWLELLRENGYVAKGVDINRVLVQNCHELGLDVSESDVIEFLRKQKPNTLGAITGFHIIEHLLLRTLIAFFDESLKVLKPGGLVILETPNTANILVSTYDFYRDPSHLKPLHPDTANFLLEMRGFIKTGAYFIDERPTGLRLMKSSEWKLNDLNDYINVSRDFVLIGYKP